ncbi:MULTISPECIES: spore cortex biosynthesis protein YabQ [unclassified Ruminococcus]|uniref:spore cortex biosynthesis protein YabQ n=1 Tax=unclassified Ruminococcus TaxID=2608920 RepID=UPI00210EA1DF|nr:MULTISPECIES: spore cortex biosynthesis protein YabQ [unclassified Ruminococcus]MCQ4022275.1 hypothetical protein [Ruminococcus sp. zg-924]MCQ4114603.1 hypothetical protein [Ruminococcus sp. zg-921]
MEISSFPQWQIFLFCLAWGLPVGVLYDVFRFLRKAGLNSKIALVVEDVVFMCICAVWLFLLACAVNLGIIRFYMGAAFFGGAILYRLTLGVLTGKCFDSIILFFTTVYRAVKRIIKRIFSFFCKQTGKITVIFCFLQKKYKEKSKNRLKVKSNKVYNYKKHFPIAVFRGRRNSREGSCKRNRTDKKAEKKA